MCPYIYYFVFEIIFSALANIFVVQNSSGSDEPPAEEELADSEGLGGGQWAGQRAELLAGGQAAAGDRPRPRHALRHGHRGGGARHRAVRQLLPPAGQRV